LAVNVYYDDMSYASIQESPQVSLSSLVGNVGGYTGLFMGASVLSFAEIFDLFVRLIVNVFNSTRKKSMIADSATTSE
jgi:hypothetical protein